MLVEVRRDFSRWNGNVWIEICQVPVTGLKVGFRVVVVAVVLIESAALYFPQYGLSRDARGLGAVDGRVGVINLFSLCSKLMDPRGSFPMPVMAFLGWGLNVSVVIEIHQAKSIFECHGALSHV
jgi:hypothetical protein